MSPKKDTKHSKTTPVSAGSSDSKHKVQHAGSITQVDNDALRNVQDPDNMLFQGDPAKPAGSEGQQEASSEGEGEGTEEAEEFLYDEDQFCVEESVAGIPSDATALIPNNEFISSPSLDSKTPKQASTECNVFATESVEFVKGKVHITIFGATGGYESNGDLKPTFVNWLLEQAVRNGHEEFFRVRSRIIVFGPCDM